MKISRTSSLKRQRIQASYVNRMTSPQNAARVEPITPSKSIENSTSFYSETILLSYEHYYEAFLDLKDQFIKYYKDEQNLGQALKNKENEMEEVLEQLNELIDKYNCWIDSLIKIEELLSSRKTQKNLEELLDAYGEQLTRMGIERTEGLKLSLKNEEFKEILSKTDHPLAQLFYPVKKIIKELYKTFRSIKLPKDLNIKKPYGVLVVKGLLVDDKG